MIRTYIIPCDLPPAEADALNRESGRIYMSTLVVHYRVYRKSGKKKRHWLSPRTGERLNDYYTRCNPPLLHAHSKDAAQQGFYHACAVAQVQRQRGLDTKYPYRRHLWRTTIRKSTGIRQQGDRLLLACARGLPPIMIRVPAHITTIPSWMVREVRLVWDRCARRYTWHLVIENGTQPAPTPGPRVVAVDLGEVRPAVCTDGQEAVVVAARELRAQRQYRAKRLSHLQAAQARTTKGSRRWRCCSAVRSASVPPSNGDAAISNIKVSRTVVDFAVERHAGTLVLGDVHDVANGKRMYAVSQQQISSWVHGRLRQYLTYKAKAAGIQVTLVNEAFSSQTCSNPTCNHRHKPTGRTFCARSVGFGHTGAWLEGSISSHAIGMVWWGKSSRLQTPSIVTRTGYGHGVVAWTRARL